MKTSIRASFVASAMLALSVFNSQFFYAFAQTAIFPIATNASVVEINGGIAASKTNYLVAFLSGTNICSRVVTTNGVDGLMVTNGNSEFNGDTAAFPIVASGTNYLEVWYDTFTSDGFGQVISRGGSAVGSRLSFSSYLPQAVASDGTNFLVVLENTTGFYGQFVTGGGALSGSTFLINDQQSDDNAAAPAAAVYGVSSYFVLMQANYNGTGEASLASGAFVSPNGSVTGPFQIAQESSVDENPLAAAFDGTNFLAVWTWDPPPETEVTVTNWQVHGRLVSQTGGFPGSEMTIATAGSPEFPAVAFNGTNYLLCWSQGLIVSNSPDIDFQFLDRSANAVGAPFTVFSALSTNSPAFAFHGLIYDGKRFVAAATLADLAVTNLNFDGILSGRVYGAFISTNAPASIRIYVSSSSLLSADTFQMTVNGAADQTFTVQMSTNVLSASWVSLMVTNPPSNSFLFTDPNATNKQRFYRVLETP